MRIGSPLSINLESLCLEISYEGTVVAMASSSYTNHQTNWLAQSSARLKTSDRLVKLGRSLHAV